MRYVVPCFLLLLGGCVRYVDQPLSPEKSMNEFESRSLDDPGLKDFAESIHPNVQFPPPKWDITALTIAGFYFQPGLEADRYHYLTTKAKIAIEQEYPNPTLILAPAFNSTTTSSDGISPWIVPVSLDFPLISSTKRNLRIARRRAQAEIDLLELAQNAWRCRQSVHQGLLGIYIIGKETELLQQQYDLQSENVKLTQQMLAAGQVSAFDAYHVRNERDGVHYALLQTKRRQGIATASLAEAIGLPLSVINGMDYDFSRFKQIPEALASEALRRQCLLNRTDLLVSMAQYKQSQLELQYEIARQYPDLTIGPGYEFDQDDNKWGLGISLELPLLNQNQAAIGVAMQKRTEMAARFNAVQADAIGRMERAVTDYRNCLEKYHSAQKLLKDKDQTIGKLQEMQVIGQISRQQVLLGLLEHNKTQLLETDALADVLQCIRKIEDEMQAPTDFADWKQPIVPVRKKSKADHEEN